MNAPIEKPLLTVRGLTTEFTTRHGVVRAVDGVDIHIMPGETLALVGESGCGKSVTSLSIMGLLQKPNARVVAGDIDFEGAALLDLPESALRDIRGNKMAMIFQEPMSSLNPVLTVGDQVMEPLLIHGRLPRAEARRRAIELLRQVRIPEPEKRFKEYPHQLSGGMRQRIMIAIALACRPSLLIADEPTTALDVTIQAQILDLICDLREEIGAAILLITHDFGVVAEMAQRVVVMYAGRKVEEAAVADIFDAPLHPYTRALLSSIPSLETDSSDRLTEIPGVVPSLQVGFSGCAFVSRCTAARSECSSATPTLMERGPGHWVACHAVGGDHA